MSENAISDENNTKVMLGVDSTDPTQTIQIQINPAWWGLMCEV